MFQPKEEEINPPLFSEPPHPYNIFCVVPNFVSSSRREDINNDGNPFSELNEPKINSIQAAVNSKNLINGETREKTEEENMTFITINPAGCQLGYNLLSPSSLTVYSLLFLMSTGYTSP